MKDNFIKERMDAHNEFIYTRGKFNAIVMLPIGAISLYLSTFAQKNDPMWVVFVLLGVILVAIAVTNFVQSHYMARPNKWYYRKASQIKYLILR